MASIQGSPSSHTGFHTLIKIKILLRHPRSLLYWHVLANKTQHCHGDPFADTAGYVVCDSHMCMYTYIQIFMSTDIPYEVHILTVPNYDLKCSLHPISKKRAKTVRTVKKKEPQRCGHVK